MAEGRYIWDMLENGQYLALMAACPQEFVFRSEENPYKQIPPLISVVYVSVPRPLTYFTIKQSISKTDSSCFSGCSIAARTRQR